MAKGGKSSEKVWMVSSVYVKSGAWWGTTARFAFAGVPRIAGGRKLPKYINFSYDYYNPHKIISATASVLVEQTRAVAIVRRLANEEKVKDTMGFWVAPPNDFCCC